MSDNKKKITLVVGARPNFMKAAPLIHEFNKHGQYELTLIHTGQHYDINLSQLFFDDLALPKSDIYLGVGSGSHGQQTGRIIIELEKELIANKPDLVIVFGDINSTLATAVVTSKLQIKLAHVESGLRSFDNSMPEEINRIVTDRLADLLFVTEQDGVKNLLAEGIDKSKIFLVGNIMTDALMSSLTKANQSDIVKKLSLTKQNYFVLTLHRPANVDDPKILSQLLDTLQTISKKLPIIFPCHPRTKKMIEQFGLEDKIDGQRFSIIEPLGYLDFIKLMKESKAVISDSGGIQGDTTILKVPCLTLRTVTEQPATIEYGGNCLCGTDPEKILEAVNNIVNGELRNFDSPPLWDGKTAQRIVETIEKFF